jgi:hypothetical protein
MLVVGGFVFCFGGTARMKLDQLEMELHPRPNAQALDLGFALLRAHAGTVYAVWLALWIPVIAICVVLALIYPQLAAWTAMLAWWVRPLLERAPLYVLSRNVFGERVTWWQALRAWPSQLGGGWFRLLTWWRVLMPSRGLYQPIWQLEGARGAVAAQRRAVIGRGTARSAYWFGIACAHFEIVLELGLLTFVGVFLSDEDSINPFRFMFDGAIGGAGNDPVWWTLLTIASYAIAAGIIAPIYTACCFSLYLNRRATLEAWDIEIVLRQIAPPVKKSALVSRVTASVLPLFLVCSLALSALPQTSFAADTDAHLDQCDKPKWAQRQHAQPRPAQTPEQVQLRRELDAVYQSDALRIYQCEQVWRLKATDPKVKKARDKPSQMPDLGLLAFVLKVLLIAAATCLALWSLYRYRDQLSALVQSLGQKRFVPATEVGGLDIRPESLPDDVTASVAQLWAQGEQRAALALLYRATLSRLVNQNALELNQGATEGDCLRIAQAAARRGNLDQARCDVTEATTQLWLNGAYGHRWPTDVIEICARWRAAFDVPANAANAAVRAQGATR